MAAKYRITVNLDDVEYELFRRIAVDTDRSLAWLGRRAICDFIEKHERVSISSPSDILAEESSARSLAT